MNKYVIFLIIFNVMLMKNIKTLNSIKDDKNHTFQYSNDEREATINYFTTTLVTINNIIILLKYQGSIPILLTLLLNAALVVFALIKFLVLNSIELLLNMVMSIIVTIGIPYIAVYIIIKAMNIYDYISNYVTNFVNKYDILNIIHDLYIYNMPIYVIYLYS
jgi:hypothetical protein